jgi:purine/pyrimidine-nucleoside phosphorylase
MITVNEYFDGAVKSLAYQSAEGKSTIGVIEPGVYEFGTSTHETMHILEGELNVKLPGNDTWELYNSGQTFEVPAPLTCVNTNRLCNCLPAEIQKIESIKSNVH